MATLVQAVRLALHYGETHLGVTDVFGEDVGPPLGGVFTATQGLKTAWNSPLDERGIIGAAMGVAYAGGPSSPPPAPPPRRWAASSPPRRASRPPGIRRWTSAASSARPWASPTPAA